VINTEKKMNSLKNKMQEWVEWFSTWEIAQIVMGLFTVVKELKNVKDVRSFHIGNLMTVQERQNKTIHREQEEI